MKKVVLAFLSLAALSTVSPLRANDANDSGERFYGKITAIDPGQKNLTVHNKKQQADARFQWNDQTAVTSDRKTIQPTELKIGQSLIVSYVTENDLNKAKKITVTHPFKKKTEQ